MSSPDEEKKSEESQKTCQKENQASGEGTSQQKKQCKELPLDSLKNVVESFRVLIARERQFIEHAGEGLLHLRALLLSGSKEDAERFEEEFHTLEKEVDALSGVRTEQCTESNKFRKHMKEFLGEADSDEDTEEPQEL